MRIGSLFSGAGGLDYGLERAGHEVNLAMRIRPRLSDHPASPLAKYSPLPGRAGGGNFQGSRARRYAGGRVSLLTTKTSHTQDEAPALKGNEAASGTPTPICIRLLRPQHVLIENVPGLATRGLGRVVYDLFEMDYVGQAFRLRAADVGAPHLRERIFIVAYTAGARDRPLRAGAPTDEGRSSWWGADANNQLGGVGEGEFSAARNTAATNSRRQRCDGWQPRTDARWRLGTERNSASTTSSGSGTNWGIYAPAVERWEKNPRSSRTQTN